METILPKQVMVSTILEQLEVQLGSFDRESVLTGLAMLEFASRALGDYEAHFARYGLSQGRFTALMFVYQFPGRRWTPAALAEAAGVRRATMTGLLQRLERDRWLVRSPNPEDRRSSVIEMTEDGRARFSGVLPDHFGRFARAFHDVDPDEHRAVRGVLADLGARLASVPPESDAP